MSHLRIIIVIVIFILIASCSQQVASKVDNNDPTSTPEIFIANENPASSGSKKIDVNDVSWLFPAPKSTEDVRKLISIADLKSSIDNKPILSAAQFEEMVRISESNDSRIGRHKIVFNNRIKDFTKWKIAGIRFDPTAPGGSDEIAAKFGRSPQIRLVIQPITTAGRLLVHDVTFHLMYTFAAGVEDAERGVFKKVIPDEVKSKEILSDLLELKKHCEDGGINTSGLLGVHPGLKAPSKLPRLRSKLIKFLNKHLHPSRITAAAVMGLGSNGVEPWIFVAMHHHAKNNVFTAVPSPGLGPVQSAPKAQMLNFLSKPNVEPEPITSNLMPMTNDLRILSNVRSGVSTSSLFINETLSTKAKTAKAANGNVIRDPNLRNSDIDDWIANPVKSHFFNTDCVSCHSETTRRSLQRGASSLSEFAFELPEGVSGVQRSVLPTSKYNVRNFGWFDTKETISLRTANEIAEVVEFINHTMLEQN